MTGMSAANEGERPGSAPNEAKPGTPAGRWSGASTVRGSIWFLEHTQDVVTITVGLILIVLASVLLISAIVDFADGTYGSVAVGAPKLLDQVLLVLILVEIVHTVVLSLRAHRLVAQPFIVVGLVAVIRRILFILSNQIPVSTSELALLIAMIVVFIAGLILVSRFEKSAE